jgi:signal transduction histidine kinase
VTRVEREPRFRGVTARETWLSGTVRARAAEILARWEARLRRPGTRAEDFPRASAATEHRPDVAALRLLFLARASQELAESIDDEGLLQRIARLAVPELADFCAIVLVIPGGALEGVAAEVTDPALAEVAQAMLAQLPAEAGAEGGLARVLREGVPQLVGEVSEAFLREAVATPEALALLRRLGLRSSVAVPLRARGRTLGGMWLGTTRAGRRLDPRDLDLALELGRRCAVTLDNARLLQQTRAQSELRDRMLAVVSHDLRNPLSTVLLGAARLAALELPPPGGEKVRSAAEQIRRSATRMKRLIEDLLDVAAIDAGQLSISPEPSAPAPLASAAAEAFQAWAREKEVQVEVDVATGLPPVRADHDRVIQALGNLVSNALAVSPAGARVRVRAVLAAGEVVFQVIDQGPGIPESERHHLFERYRRGARAGYRGTGLGLSIARGIVEAHGGRIWVESAEGRGSTFCFTLPVAHMLPPASRTDGNGPARPSA